MATCEVCGSEISGPYCDQCGAKAPELVASRKPPAETQRSNKTQQRPAAKGHTPQPVAVPTRGWGNNPVLMAIVGVLLFGAGIVTGYWLAAKPTTLTSTAVNSSTAAGPTPPSADMPAIVQAEQWMDLGIDAMDKGQRSTAVDYFRKSITQFEKALQDAPNDLYARSYLGLVYFYVGDDTKAIATDQEVLAKDPNYLWAIFNLAWIYQSTGKSTEALGMYQKYLNVAPTEKENKTKYAEQYELIDRQVEAAKQSLAKLQGGGTK